MNRKVAILFFGSLFLIGLGNFPPIIAAATSRTLGAGTVVLLLLPAFAAIPLLAVTFLMTLANWRFLTWRWRLLGLLSVPIAVVVVLEFNRSFPRV
jgi:hypothetical protein